MKACHKVGSEWREVAHYPAASMEANEQVPLGAITATLRSHVFQEEAPPGLYPVSPTVCSCGTTPPTRPDEGDWAWWLDHVATILTGGMA